MSTFRWEDNQLLHYETLALLFHCKTVLNDGEDRVFKLSIRIRTEILPVHGVLEFTVVPPYLDVVESIIRDTPTVFDHVSPEIYASSWFDSDMIPLYTVDRQLTCGKKLPRTITCSVIIPPRMDDIMKSDMVIRKIKGDEVLSLYLPLPY